LLIAFCREYSEVHFRFIPTKRGGETVVIDGYMFRVSKCIATKKYWKCEEGDCKVTAISE